MAGEESCLTRLLADAPAETDAFGAHERVAQSIADVVHTEDGGRSIGLEGGWGAGKSTVVTLISKILGQTKDPECRIAVFDIWAHQDDPLRRTFLENLITRIQVFGWVDQEKWRERLDELARRRREDTTRVVPRLTSAGLVFALTLLCIPLGAALVSAGTTLLASKNASGTWPLVLLVLGIAGVLAPVICYAFAWLRHRRKRVKLGGSEEGGDLSEFPALVTGQASTESRTIVTQTPDPTSVEFESVFRELLDDALGCRRRKLLLVIDNLDRVQPSDALAIWSTLQTFLGHSDYQRPEWINRLWVLIPYDGNAILRLWDGTGNDDTVVTKSALAKSFLDKTFQMRFSVPPLLLTDWRGFLQEALQQALPNHQEADFRDVYRAFAAKGGLEKSAPTPRDLKIFVNQIGTLHRVRQDEFALSHLACYVLLQRDGTNVRNALLSEKDLPFPMRIIGKEWREIIAALHFGVPAQEARQLLLRDPIQVALANGDGDSLSRLASTHPTGFWAVLEDSVPAGAQDWNTLSPAEIAKAATALAESQVLAHANSRPEAAALQSSIRTAATAVRAWGPFDAANAQGMVAVARLVAVPEEIVPVLVSGASNAPVEAPEGTSNAEIERVSPSVWMASALALIKGLVEAGLGKQIEDGVKVPLDAQQWLDVSHEVAEKDPHGQLLKYFGLQAIAEIDELLAQRAVPGQIDESTFDAVRAAMATKSGNAMNNVAGVVFSHLESGEGIPGDQLVFMLKILRFSRSGGLIERDQYEGYATSGHYLHHLHQAVSENYPEAVGECMFGYLEAVPDAREPAQVGNSHAGYQNLSQLLQDPDTLPGAVEHFTALAKETKQLPAVFAMTTGERPVPPFVSRVLRTLLVSEDVSKAPELVMANWSVIREVLETEEEDSQDLETFLKRFRRLDSLVASVVSGTFDVRDSGLYVALLKSDADTNLVTWCTSGLPSVSQDAWSKEIASRGDLLDLVTELKTRGASVVLGVAYYDALIECAEGVAEGPERTLADESWSDLLTLLDADHQVLFPRRVYNVLEASDGEASPEFFNLFGDMISSRELLANERRFIDQVCRPILNKGNARGIAWVANIVNSDPALLTRHGDQPASNDFKDRIRQRLDDTSEDDPTFRHLKEIGAVLGIECLESEESETES